MDIPLTCINCQRQLTVNERFRGQLFPCPHCQFRLRVPYGPPTILPLDDALQDDLPVVEAITTNRPRRKAAPPGRPRRPWVLWLMAFLPLGIPLLSSSLGAQADLNGQPNNTGWVIVGIILFLLCLAGAMRSAWPLVVRWPLVLVTTLLGYLSVMLMAVLFPGPRTIDPAAWQRFQGPDGDFFVSLPGKPTHEVQAIPGSPLPATVYKVRRSWEGLEFAVSHFDLPPEEAERIPLLERYRSCRDGMLKHSSGNKLVEEGSAFIGHQPGWQVVLHSPSKGTAVVRMTLINRRFFLLIVGGRSVQPKAASVQDFFDSFGMVWKDTPVPPVPVDCRPGTRSLVWRFDEGNGSDTLAASNPDRKGTLQNATWISGVWGKGVGLEPGRSRVLFEPTALRFGPGEPFTLTCWLRTGGRDGLLILAGDPDKHLLLRVVLEDGVPRATLSAPTAPLTPENADTVPNETATLEGARINDGKWHHFALRREANGPLELLIDGRVRASENGRVALGEVSFKRLALGGAPRDPLAMDSWNSPFTDPPRNTAAAGFDELGVFDEALQNLARLAGQPNPLPPVVD